MAAAARRLGRASSLHMATSVTPLLGCSSRHAHPAAAAAAAATAVLQERQHVGRPCSAAALQHAAPYSSRSTTCVPPSPALHQRDSSRSVRCYSTPNLNPPSGSSSSSQHISWLQEVQVWCPEPQTTSTSGSSSSSTPGFSSDGLSKGQNGSNGQNSSSSNNGSNNDNSIPTAAAAAVYRPLRFKQVSEAQLSPAGPASSSSFDAIIVLAGGLTPDGGLPEWVCRRMDVARDLHLLQGRRPAIVCSGGGTPHKPAVVGPNGHVIHESTSGATYLMNTGVQPGAIYKEVSSYDTVGNAYYSLCIHVIPAGWRRLAVVTSDFHMPRSRALFADIYRLAGQSLFGDAAWYSLTFLSASDEGVFDAHVYNTRLGKEVGSLTNWEAAAADLPDLPAFWQWIHTDHLCYAVPRQHEFGKRTIQDQRLLDSY